MKTLIAIPAMDRMYTITAQCLANIQPVGDYGTKFMIGMQVDMARNLLAKFAIEHGFDRILWIDSDMTFDPDIMERLSADLDAGYDVVCGIFFKRKFPAEPVIYKRMSPERIEPAREAVRMAEEMERGLAGQSASLPMIPTYISDTGTIPREEPVVVIDAGGTNFRCGLVRFTEEGCQAERIQKWKMPGIEKPASWEDFIRFTADAVEPLMPFTDKIGFCFSYSADITPEMDGKVQRIDKEVVITGCEGQLVGASLLAELARRGYPGKKIVILNDTVAVLLDRKSVV